LVLPGISHTGDNGILGGNAVNMQNVLPHINDALAVDNDASYDALAQEWDDLTAQWKNADNNTAQCNSTVVFSLRHPGGRKVEDSLILIKDQNAAGTPQELSNVGDAIEDRQPIQNDTTPSSVSFYLNYDKFQTTYPHLVHIEVSSGCDEINYPVVNYPVLINSSAAVGANEFAYVKVTLKREPQETYQVIPWSDNPNLTTPWPPLPKPAGS
jgi:hypothetical protein